MQATWNVVRLTLTLGETVEWPVTIQFSISAYEWVERKA